MSRLHPRLASLCLLTALATVASGCVATIVTEPTNLPVVALTPAPGDRAPIIQALDYSPKSAVGKNDAITFTVVVTDPEGQPLQYTWAATKGTLSTNSGQVVSWRPTKADGSLEPGLTTISVTVSDGRQATTGSLNVMIDDGGQANVVPSAAPSPVASPTATPAATPTPSPSDDGAIPGQVLFEDGFEGGIDQWEVGSTFIGDNWNPLSWKAAVSGAQAGKAAAVLNDGDEEVKPDTKQDLIWIQAKAPIDLTAAKLPRVRLYAKSGAVPADTVTYRLFFSPTRANAGMVPDQHYVGSPFQAGAAWTRKDIDLSSKKGQAGYLAVCLEVQRNGNTFAGPMVDSVTVYDAGQ